ncbi:hypothetical protein ACLOAU_23620 [Niabella sp. CJ426]|uniref:hypothetical protein n=1 Tax=Niabella sp. CJ426 TaxID=3393740 RepID=UPI003D035AFA
MRIPTFFIFFLIYIIGLSGNAVCQNNAELPQVRQLHKIKVSVLGLTYQWEKPVSRKSVLTLEGGIAGGMSFSAGSISGTEFRYAIVPEVGLGFKNYYNLDKRFKKGKNINNNAANFIATDVFVNGNPILSSGNITAREAVGLTAAWGMQRFLSSKINFEWQGGVIGGTDFREWVIAPNLRIAFSLVAGNKGK